MAGPRIRSAVVIARLLDTEGFTDHVANLVTKYYYRTVARTQVRVRMRRTKAAVSEVMAKMSAGDRIIIGRFIGMHKKIAFDTGLRIGLTTIAVKNNQELGIDTV